MSARPRLVHLCGAPLHIGGLERHILALAEVGRDEYEVVIVAPGSEQYRAQAEKLGVQFHFWEPRKAFDWKAMRALKKILQDLQPALIDVHDSRAGFQVRLLRSSVRACLVYTVHVPPYDYHDIQGLRGRFTRWAYRQIERPLNYLLTDWIVFVAESNYRDAIRQRISPKSRTLVALNAIDLRSFAAFPDEARRQELRRGLGASPSEVVICCVARLGPQKNVGLLVRAVAQIPAPSTNFRVWLVGDGSERPGIEALASELGVQDKIDFLGFRSDTVPLLHASDMFVLPSDYEGRPAAVMEAQAAGKACVVTDVDDNPYLVDDGANGLVVPVKDAAAMARAIHKLLEEADLRERMGRAAREKALAQYSLDAMLSKRKAFYREALEGRSKQA